MAFTLACKPPLTLVAWTLVLSLSGGAVFAHAAFMERSLLCIWVLPITVGLWNAITFPSDVSGLNGLGVCSWFVFGISAPLWIWRKGGMKKFASSDVATSN